MYIPHAYRNENIAEIEDFIRQNSFAILINQVDDSPWATHIPLELHKNKAGEPILVGHLAKANVQWKSFKGNPNVLVVFNGPHSYVSSSWYEEEEVPTWNYIAVHVYGKTRLQNEQELYDSLVDLVDRYEKNSDHPVSVHTLSKRTMRQIRGIVGIEISIEKVQAAYKLSQGRDHDHKKIIEELEKREDPGSLAIAGEMKSRSAQEHTKDD